MARVAWTLTDNSTGTPEVLEFEINPNEFEPPGRQATITAMHTAAPSGGQIIFAGANQPSIGTMSGAVNTEEFYSTLKGWFEKWWPLTLTDDLGNTWNILIQTVRWTRLRRAIRPHRYDYNVDFMEL